MLTHESNYQKDFDLKTVSASLILNFSVLSPYLCLPQHWNFYIPFDMPGPSRSGLHPFERTPSFPLTWPGGDTPILILIPHTIFISVAKSPSCDWPWSPALTSILVATSCVLTLDECLSLLLRIKVLAGVLP